MDKKIIIQALLGIAFRRGGVSDEVRKYLKEEGLIKVQITEKGKDLVLDYLWKGK